MNYFNDNLRNKAYFLEFCEGNDVKESFSFCLPPQSEQINSPQKVYETKTFGGSVIDDYGNDIEELNLSGSTYNTEIRKIYSGGSRKHIEVTGEEEIFLLRKLLRTYGTKEKLVNKHVYISDLSSPDFKSWEVFPKSLRIDRSEGKPFSYNYNFSLLAVDIEKRHKSLVEWIDTVVKRLNNLKIVANKNIGLLSVGMSFLDQTLEKLRDIQDKIQKAEKRLQAYVDTVNGSMLNTASKINEIVGLGDYIIKSPLRMFAMGISVFNSTSELLKSCNNLKDWVCNIPYDLGNMSEIIVKQYNASISEVIDEWNRLTNQLCTEAESVHAAGIMATSNNGYVIIPGGEDDDSTLITYGNKERVLTDKDTWDAIANEVYGDPSLGVVLALYNGTISEDSSTDIKPGKIIYIPILEASQKISNNEVYNEPGIIDNYGSDILIQDGDYATFNGDLAIVTGVENLTQAILSRLSTSINNRIRNNVYGIKSLVGLPVALTNNYIATSLKQTVIEDPRINDINGLSWKGNGDSILIEFSYRDINDNNQSYGGI